MHVVENSVINRVAFEGNKKVKSEQLEAELTSKSRGPYSPALRGRPTSSGSRTSIADPGNGNAKVTSRTVDLPNGRLDVVFTIDEGWQDGRQGRSTFVGNQAYSERKLRGLMTTTEMNLLSWLKTSDVYDPDKIASDEDLIRRFYLKQRLRGFSHRRRRT